MATVVGIVVVVCTFILVAFGGSAIVVVTAGGVLLIGCMIIMFASFLISFVGAGQVNKVKQLIVQVVQFG